MRHLVLTIAMLAGCRQTVFVCADDASCGPGGTCAPTGYCGFADDGCASGLRYSDLAGDGLAGTCVGDDLTVDAAVGPPWWDDAWATRVRVTVTAEAAIVAGYELGIPVDLDELVGAGSVDAVRVVVHDGAAATERPRVLEYGVVDRIWTSFDTAMTAGETRDLWIYVANAAAGPAPDDPHDVFYEYEPWDEVDSFFYDTSGTVSAIGGELVLAANGVVTTFFDYEPGLAFDASVRAPTWGTSFDLGWWWEDTSDLDYWVIGWESDPAGGMAARVDFTGDAYVGSVTEADAGYHVWSVERSRTDARFLLDHAPIVSRPLFATVDLDMMLELDNDTTSTIYLDWSRVRRWTDPPPVVAVQSDP